MPEVDPIWLFDPVLPDCIDPLLVEVPDCAEPVSCEGAPPLCAEFIPLELWFPLCPVLLDCASISPALITSSATTLNSLLIKIFLSSHRSILIFIRNRSPVLAY